MAIMTFVADPTGSNDPVTDPPLSLPASVITSVLDGISISSIRVSRVGGTDSTIMMQKNKVNMYAAAIDITTSVVDHSVDLDFATGGIMDIVISSSDQAGIIDIELTY